MDENKLKYMQYLSVTIGLLSDISFLKRNNKDSEDTIPEGCITRECINHYWTKKSFDSKRLMLGIGVDYMSDDIIKSDTHYILVDDLLKGVDKNNTLLFTYNHILSEYSEQFEGMTLECFISICKDLIKNYGLMKSVIPAELYNKSKLCKSRFSEEDIFASLDALNMLAQNAPAISKLYTPFISYNSESGYFALDTAFLCVPIDTILDFKTTYPELGSIIATTWVSTVVDMYREDFNPLLTVMQLTCYVVIVLLDMFKCLDYLGKLDV